MTSRRQTLLAVALIALKLPQSLLVRADRVIQ